jgi:hypothetical protein
MQARVRKRYDNFALACEQSSRSGSIPVSICYLPWFQYVKFVIRYIRDALFRRFAS